MIGVTPAQAAAQLPPSREPAGHSQATRDVMVVNHASSPIVEVYVSASSDDSWGDNRLGRQPVPQGGASHLVLPPGRDCMVDIRVVYGDGRAEDRLQVDICRIRQLAFTATAAALPNGRNGIHRVTVENRGSHAITEIFFSPASSDSWGANLIDHPVTPGAQGQLAPAVGCVADVRIVFDTHAAEERRRIDICRNVAITIKPGWTTSDELVPSDDSTSGPRPDHRT